MSAGYVAVLSACVTISLLIGLWAGRYMRLSRIQGLVWGLAMALLTLTVALLTRTTYA